MIVRNAVSDYANRDCLSVVEVTAYAGLPVREIHRRVKAGELAAFKSANLAVSLSAARCDLPARPPLTRQSTGGVAVVVAVAVGVAVESAGCQTT